jgi:hypothetical protein
MAAANVAILEDDVNRVREMRACLEEVLPGAGIVVFEVAAEMIAWLGAHLGEVVLISLDHDLPLRDDDGRTVDCGSGREVADFLAPLAPTCPVIVHSSNQYCAPGMYFALKEAGWPVSRVCPMDDLEWVKRDWAARVTRYVLEGWIEGGPPGDTTKVQ